MAVIPTCSIVIPKDMVHPKAKLIILNQKSSKNGMQRGFQYFQVCNTQRAGSKWHAMQHNSKSCLDEDIGHKDDLFHMVHHRSSLQFKKTVEAAPFMVYGMTNSTAQKSSFKDILASDASMLDNTGRQLKALDSYFSKLQRNVNDQGASCVPRRDFQTNSREEYGKKSFPWLKEKNIEDVSKSNSFKPKSGLGSLDSYFGKLNNDVVNQKENSESSEVTPTIHSNLTNEEYLEDGKTIPEKLDNFATLPNIDDGMSSSMIGDKSFKELQPQDEASDFYLISLLVSVNVAVFLIEIASPVGNSNMQQLSLPLVYGAKVNKLILDGEWWRLVTPMFLHSGFLHVALSCWALLTFGPQVCRRYGPLTFFLIYILGGICANLASFIHTPELTVCGTGPVFALIGAWLVYQFQNKEAVEPEVSENMFRMAVITTALTFLLSDGQIDEWTHLGATFSGVLYGYLTCPTVQLDNMPTKKGQKDGLALVGKKADPCKSILTFIIFLLTLCPLVYMFEPDLNLLELENFL